MEGRQLGSCFIFSRMDLCCQWQKAMNHEDKIMLTRVLSKENKMAPQLVALYMLVLSNNRCVYREWSIPCNPSETKALWHHNPLWFTLGLEEWLSPWVWQNGVVVEGVPIYLCHPYHAAHLCWVKTEMCAVKSGSVKTCTRHESLATCGANWPKYS